MPSSSACKYQNDISKTKLAKSVISMRQSRLKDQKITQSESTTKKLMSLYFINNSHKHCISSYTFKISLMEPNFIEHLCIKKQKQNKMNI